MRFTRVLLTLVVVWLTGCAASLPRDSGFEVRAVEAIGRQEPWQNRALDASAFAPEGVWYMYFKLPAPLPSYWQQEFVDAARSYEIVEGGRKVRQPLIREVFRVVVFLEPGKTELYQAHVDRGAKGFDVFFPLSVDARRFARKSILILSSDGKWGMTTLGKRVEFPKGFNPKELPADFFVTNRSPVMQVVRLDPINNEHARLALDGMLHSFTYTFGLREQNGRYLGKSRQDVEAVMAFTSLDGVSDRLISCTSLKLSPGMEAALPVIGALYAYQAVSALTKEDCLK